MRTSDRDRILTQVGTLPHSSLAAFLSEISVIFAFFITETGAN
jgi:hypothetical protein